jgi:hypothetical protein
VGREKENMDQLRWAVRGGRKGGEGWASKLVSTQEVGGKLKYVFLFLDFIFKQILFEFK